MSTRFVITTRPEEKSGLRNNIECLEIRNVPLTKLVPVPFDREELLRFDPEVFIFTSSYGAGIFARTFGRTFSERMAIAIGDATAAALRESFSKVSVPEKKTSEGIVDKLESEGFYRKRIALLSSEKSNHVVENYLIQKKMRFRSWHL
ncbi:MAG TPA: uroporphyrinogen-III synthase, partial [Thermoplasmataceae archaeon]|nr:uroporphyrinogen-III synthase [Thermoplasmataceae archaeon]